MKRIRVSRYAERDLDRIWHYIAADAQSIDIADRVIKLEDLATRSIPA